MIETIWVVCTRNAITKTVKTPPVGLKASEYAFKLKIEVPDSIFVKAPVPVVSVTLTPDAVQAAEVTVGGQPQEQSVNAQGAKQLAVQSALAEMLTLARNSPDAAIREHSKTILGALMDAGAEVRLTADAPASDDETTESEAGE